ncbi:MAG: four helix bundle protein, partial [Kofleriaceae bacterium]|nr:four helix bundle protein [Kofleriaceae bacterium]
RAGGRCHWGGGGGVAGVLRGAGWVGYAGPRRPALTTGVAMQLRIADDIVQTVGALHQLSRVIARQDADLSKQLRSALNSIGLNAGEGLFARAGNRTVRLESAMASGREVIMALRIAGAAGYVNAERVAREVDAVDRIVATLYKLAYRAR